MQTIKKLIKYGFNEAEAVVYLDVLSNMDSSAFEIYKRTKIPKTSVYNVLESLQKRGVIESWKKNGVSYFSAESPKRLLSDLKEKEDLIQELLPTLSSLSSKIGQSDSVKMYEGEEGLKKVMRDSLIYCEKNNIKTMLTAATNIFSLKMPRFINQWVTEREGAGIFVKMLMPETNRIPKDFETNKLRETRFLPSNFELPGIINIYGDRVDLFSIKDNKLNSVVIDSKTYSTLLSNFFLLAWGTSAKK